jgi:hypothetical protein
MSPPSTPTPNLHAQCCPRTSRATRCQRIVSRMEFMNGNDSEISAIKPQRRIASKTKRKGSLTSSPQGTFITSPSADNTSNIQSADSHHTPKKSRHGEVKSNASSLRWTSGSEDSDDSENENENESDSSNISSTKPRCPSLNKDSGSETSSSEDEYTPSSSDESDSDVSHHPYSHVLQKESREDVCSVDADE